MPRFSIRRKKPEEQPQEPTEEKIDDQEISVESESEPSEQSEPLTEQMETLKLDESPSRRPQQYYETQTMAPRRTREARVERYPPNPARYRQNYEAHRRVAPQQYRNPRSIDYPKPLRSQNGARKLQFGSHFGPGGHSLSTQEKARRLYYSCFG